jgi:O-acetyl-ADP-ribose deacetylase (regulator of RNase III)
MIKFVSGDFFDYEAELRINTVNCVGVMGAGVALTFKTKFPAMFSDYAKACKRGLVTPGKPHVWKETGLFNEELTIINFPTKTHWRKPSEYEYIIEGLKWLREYLVDYKGKTITVPALGCGHGGLDWNRVKSMIFDSLADLELEILVFEPKSSTKTDLSKSTMQQLSQKGIRQILPSDEDYPSKIRGKSSTELFVLGNSTFLEMKSIAFVVDPKASLREKEAIRQLIQSLSGHNIVFVLGFSSSFEKDLALELILMGEKVLAFSPDGILNIQIRKDIKNVIEKGCISLVSHTKPLGTWKKYERINSLKLRMRLSDSVVITNLNLNPLEKFAKEFTGISSIFQLDYGQGGKTFLDTIATQKIRRSPQSLLPNIKPLLNTLHLA